MNSEVKFGHCLFQGCINLAEVTLSESPYPRESELQARVGESAPGCFSSTGITALALPMHFVTLGAHACDSCRLLESTDLCNTQVEAIPEFAFVHCTSLSEKLRVATLHGRLPTSPGSLAHNRLSHSSGTVRNLSLKPPNTSENFKRCTSCSQTLAPFSHTSQTNWP